MTIKNKYFYFITNEWHHLYLGLIMVSLWGFSEVIGVLGVFVAVDDLIQHYLQGKFIYKHEKMHVIDQYNSDSIRIFKNEKNYYIKLPQFLLHTLTYEYLKLGKYKWIRKITSYLNKLLH